MRLHLDLVPLVERWEVARRPEQDPILWPIAPWKRRTRFRPDQVGFLDSLPQGRISRQQVQHACADAHLSKEHAARSFIAAMVWGYGDVGYGAWRTERILYDRPGVDAKLQKAAEINIEKGALAAYQFMSGEGRIHWLGPAFGTKYLAFLPAPEVDPRSLILDALVVAGIKRLTGEVFGSYPWSPTRNERYLNLMTKWSGCRLTPEELEILIFENEQGARANS